jgi:phosphoglycolate phosphatase-like HAD superfamily hydrolase
MARASVISGRAVHRIFAEHAPPDLFELGVPNMKETILRSGINRRTLLKTLALLPALSAPPLSVFASAQTASSGPLPSWNEGSAKQAILDFVRDTTDRASPKFVPPEERIATFDQDGTLWVEQPIYSQMVYCLDRVPVLAAQEPALKEIEPFKTVLSGNREAIARLSMRDLEKIAVATLAGITTDEFEAEGKKWLASAKDPRWKRPYTELVYQPMLEVMTYLRANGFKTYIVTGFGQDFVRLYSQQVYGIPPEQVVGSALAVKYDDDKDGKPVLISEPRLMLNDSAGGKPEGIHLIIGRRPNASFGNSTGDQQMLEYTGAGDGARLSMLVLHDDAIREYAYGPAQGLPDTKIGSLTPALYAEAKKKNWAVISMKNDWKKIFSFE